MKKGSTASSTTCRSRRDKLLVIAPNWLGDATMATPFLLTLRAAFGDMDIDLLCRGYVADVFRNGSFIDRLIEYDRSGGVWAGARAARASRPGRGWRYCFVLSPSFSAALIAFVSGAPKRVGYAGELRGPLLTDTLPSSAYRSGHLSAVYMRLAEMVTEKELGDPPLPVVVPPYEWQEIKEAKGLADDYFVIAPGAEFGSAKKWPSARFSDVASRLAARTGWMPAAVGTAQESEALAGIIRSAGENGMNLAGKCSVRELIAVLRGARIVVGNDSGPVHLSAAMGRPTVAVFGSTSPEWTAPRGAAVRVLKTDTECAPCFKRECPDGDPRCLTGLEADQVYEAAVKLIEEECCEKA